MLRVKSHSEETKKQISNTLTGKTHSIETKLKMSLSHKGNNNVFYNKSLPKATLDAAALVNSDPVWVYYEDSAPATPGRDPGPLRGPGFKRIIQ